MMSAASRTPSGLALAGLLAAITACSPAGSGAPMDAPAPAPMPAPAPAPALRFTQADGKPSPEVIAFLDAAQTARAIADPLARCLAFPDLPGNQWPAGLAKAHCEFLYGERLTGEEIKARIHAGDLAALDARLAADLARHFDDAHFSEAIHRDYADIDGSPAWDALTRRWTTSAPDSGFAAAARGQALLEQARQARGGEWAQETPDSNMERMHRFSTQSIAEFERALSLQPRLLAAHVGLMAAGNLSSDEALIEANHAMATRIDPACKNATGTYMESLEPRWGGSQQAMEAFAASLRQHVARRPLLALNTIWPQVDRGDMLVHHERMSEALAVLRPIPAQTTQALPYELIVQAMSGDGVSGGDDPWYALVLLLEADRFDPGNAWVVTRLEQMLTGARTLHPGLAEPYARQAIALNPGSTSSRYHLAKMYAGMGRNAEAVTEYRVLVDTGNDFMRRLARPELVESLLAVGDLAAAREQVEQVTADKEAEPEHWLLQYRVLDKLGVEERWDALQRYVDTVDRDSPLDGDIAQYEALLREHRGGATPPE